jgi:hypothetical protein
MESNEVPMWSIAAQTMSVGGIQRQRGLGTSPSGK